MPLRRLHRGARDLDRLGGHRACRDGVTAEQAQPGRLPERASAAADGGSVGMMRSASVTAA